MRYADPVAFRRALEDRLKTRAGGDGAWIARERKRIAFDRLLARLLVAAPNQWLLKGGFALDVRLADRARTTKDIDLDWPAADEDVLDLLLEAVTHQAGDFFVFAIERTMTPADRLGGSRRFRVNTALAGRPFETFLLDVGDHELVGPAESLAMPDVLGFAGIAPMRVPTLPLAQQVAEKLHAYTRRYEGDRVSSRAKDLVDLVLIAELFPLAATELRHAVEMIFTARGTHPRPAALPRPPTEWAVPFQQLANSVGITGDLTDGYAIAACLLNPVLDDRAANATWHPENQEWR